MMDWRGRTQDVRGRDRGHGLCMRYRRDKTTIVAVGEKQRNTDYSNPTDDTNTQFSHREHYFSFSYFFIIHDNHNMQCPQLPTPTLRKNILNNKTSSNRTSEGTEIKSTPPSPPSPPSTHPVPQPNPPHHPKQPHPSHASPSKGLPPWPRPRASALS